LCPPITDLGRGSIAYVEEPVGLTVHGKRGPRRCTERRGHDAVRRENDFIALIRHPCKVIRFEAVFEVPTCHARVSPKNCFLRHPVRWLAEGSGVQNGTGRRSPSSPLWGAIVGGDSLIVGLAERRVAGQLLGFSAGW
jgi:hypothetical protein